MSRKRVAAWSAALAALAFAAVALTLRRGILVGWDEWLYWQASVSLLAGDGYRELCGRALTRWPPLYPLFLAGVQGLLGVSGRSAVLATALATGGAVCTWGWLLGWFARMRDRTQADFALGLGFVALVLVLFAFELRSETLAYVLLPLPLGFVLRARASESATRTLAEAAFAGLALALCLLVRNAAAALCAGAAAVLLLQPGLRRRVRAAAVALMTVVAVSPWLAVRFWLGQVGSHTMGLGVGRRPMAEYLWQLVSGIDLNTNLQFLGLPLLVVLAVALVRGDRSCAADRSRGLGAVVLVFVGVSLAALFAIFNSVRVSDPLTKRHTLFVTLIVGGLGLQHVRQLARGRWLALLLVLVFAQPGLRAARHAWRGRGPETPAYTAKALREFLPVAATIRAGHVGEPPEPQGEWVLVSPPVPPCFGPPRGGAGP